ncbi:MAG: metallophosphoesterase family protein [Pseudomonadota bacterium]
MRILAFSDLHLAQARAADLVAASAEADLVIGAGDFCNMRHGLDEAMTMLSGLAGPVVIIPGNAESAEELREAAPVSAIVLHGEGTSVGGLHIFGLGYGIPETPFGDWSCDLSEAAARTYLNRCSKVDIMVTHSPPKGVADRTSAGQSVGSVAVHEAILRLQPALAFCGHIHDSWRDRGRIGQTEVANLGPFVNWFEVPA